MRMAKRWRKRLRALVRRDAVDREMDEELAFHMEMETQQNLRAGMSPEEARRRAALAFGGVERFKEEVRDARSLGWVSGASLDLKLGLRMLAKYPGLTLVGGIAMAFAIAVGAATFELVAEVVHPRLPLPDGDRVVGIRILDAEAGRPEERVAGEFLAWRGELRTLDELGAFRGASRNLIVPGGSAEPVAVAEMTASGFRLAGSPPLLGRYLVDADEREGAPPVAVLDHRTWRTRFAGDPGVVGREVRLGGTVHTVVGVMPEDFGFPVSQGMWTPLRLGAREYPPGEGPRLRVFGRLAPGATLDAARAELSTLARRRAADSPETHRHLRPQVQPYARAVLDIHWRIVTGAAYSTNLGVLMFLVLVCANVAALVFARTAARESELVVRTALGASRRRIVLQLFLEALVLGSVAAVVGLAAAGFGLRWGLGAFETVQGEIPFWIDADLEPRTVLYTAVLALLAAGVAGVLPALKITGRGTEARLRQAGGGGGSARFGRLWTGIIMTQVALTAAFVPIVADVGMDTEDIRTADAGFRAEEYLSARLEVDRETVPGVPVEAPPEELDARLRAAYAEMERRLEAEPGVAGVTYAGQMPGAYHPRRPVEVDGPAAPPESEALHRVQAVSVAPDFFDVLGTPVLAGRGFVPGDLAAGQDVVVVNESFVREILGGGNPVGRRFRYPDPVKGDEPRVTAGEPDRWYEIVGVARDVTLTVDPDLPHNAGIYHPAAPGGGVPLRMAVHLRGVPLRMAVHLRGDPEAFAPRLRALAAAVDPTLRLHELRPVADAREAALVTYEFWVRVAGMACAVVLLLSVLGIHSIMAFTVSRRTREIGIRVALGADRRRIVAAVFSRSFRQVALGVGVGVLLLVVLTGGIHSMKMVGLLAASVAVMLGATAVACIVPTRRVLGIQPTEAMRADA
ncbi:MAG TPA: ABC transporter permease [Longimicrobiaceae bacterium]|nr:ABC transporter permease [Longimicrobiaceae bacterium]